MRANGIDLLVIAAYLAIVLGVGILKGRGHRTTAAGYFVKEISDPRRAVRRVFTPAMPGMHRTKDEGRKHDV